MNKQIYVHIGFPRTGTTFLQEEVFPYIDTSEVYYISHSSNNPIKDILVKLTYTNIYLNPINKEEFEQVESFLLSIKQNKIFISLESLTGDVFDNHFPYIVISEALKQLFPSAKILIIIRRQDDLIKSYYLYSLYEGHFKTFKKFINYIKKPHRQDLQIVTILFFYEILEI